MRNNGRAARFLRTWREDYTYQTLMSAAASFVCTALFALYNGYLGVRYGSVWHGSIGIFYLLLTAIRGIVLLTEMRNRVRLETEKNCCRRRTFLISYALLLMLDLALILPISMMVETFPKAPSQNQKQPPHLRRRDIAAEQRQAPGGKPGACLILILSNRPWHPAGSGHSRVQSCRSRP